MSAVNWKEWLDYCVQVIADIYHVLSLLKIQLFVAGLSIVLFLVPGQIVEIYRLLSEDYLTRWPQIIMAVVGMTFLTFMLWYSARWITIEERADELNSRSRISTYLKWLPRLFAVGPGLAVGGLLLFTPGSVGALFDNGGQFWIRMTGLAILAITLVFLGYT